jgi:hypothetical protein
VSRYAVGDRVIVNRIDAIHRDKPTGVVTRLPYGASPYYIVVIDGGDELYLPLDEILGEAPPVNPSPTQLLEWLRS